MLKQGQHDVAIVQKDVGGMAVEFSVFLFSLLLLFHATFCNFWVIKIEGCYTQLINPKTSTMKKLVILSILVFIITSCTKDDEITDSSFLGEWKLVKTTAPFDNSERTGMEMEWQESYTLREDGTFTKTRVRDNETLVAEGTFIIHQEPYHTSGIAHIIIVYESENNIIATCYSDKIQEDLYFQTKNVMKSTWQHCDGLGLKYAKKQ